MGLVKEKIESQWLTLFNLMEFTMKIVIFHNILSWILQLNGMLEWKK